MEPIAIIGMACRFAGGVESLDVFWNLLREGRDTVGELDEQRWEWYASQGREHGTAVQGVTRKGSFLNDIKGFDAEFFDITPREAAVMDPQQRIVLELAWEALEHAGIAPSRLAGTDTGVFMGVGADDYGRRLLEDLPRIEAWSGIGGAYCAVANRVSYTLDFRGPSVSVDTACSSSLVAIHLATQALRDGECPIALAGGVLVMAAPGLSLVLDAAGATSPDGRCKSFDASADGYGRGEGGGVIVLKLLSHAKRDGDRILAVIRGSAVHQDGKTNGIMAPSGPAQAHLMRRAYESAGIDPATASYVEAHGTGTRAGDPLEASALAEVFDKLLIGSVKTNIGHLEAGAGVAGVIKTVLALNHGVIPPSLNFTTPNPAIPWDKTGLRVVTESTPWPGGPEPRRAGVSGYGYGGTIAHVILEEAHPPTRSNVDAGSALYPLSARSETALLAQATRLADHLESRPDVSTEDVGHTLAHRRDHLTHRAAVYAADRAQLIAGLRELSATTPAAAETGVVWVFSGHGSQWTGMGRELLDTDPVFATVLAEIDPIFVAEMGFSPRVALLDDAPKPVDVVQPLIFAIQVALAASWRALGLSPAAVVGHSVGEIAAAVTAGALTLEQGARLVCRRSLLLRRAAGRGAMAMVDLPARDAEAHIGVRSGVCVAVAASPGSAVISGDIGAVTEVCAQWEGLGRTVRRVDSDVAFHSPHMDPLLDELANAAADLPPTPARIPLYSTALADPRSQEPRDGAYWAGNLRHQVRFTQAIAAAAEDGYRSFLEVSPHPVVEHSIIETLDGMGIEGAFVTHSLRRNRPERELLLTNLGRLYCQGAPVDWTSVWPGGTLVDLPGVAWQHRPYWAEEPVGRSFLTEQHDPTGHCLLGGRINVYGTTPARVWLTYLDRQSRPYPGEHPVRGVEIIPAAVLLNTFLTAGSGDLVDVTLRVPVSLTDPRYVQVFVQDGTVRLSSRIADDGADDLGWITNTTAALRPHEGLHGETLKVAVDRELPPGHVIDRLATLGVAGMGFPWEVERIQAGDEGLVVTVRTNLESTWASILDAALSAASVAFPGPPLLRLPAHIDRVTLAPTAPARARITVRRNGENTVDAEIADLDGLVVGRITALRYGDFDSEHGAVTNPRHLVHEIEWRPIELKPERHVPNVVLVGPDTALLGRLIERLGDAAVNHRVVATPEALHDNELSSEHTIVVVPAPRAVDDIAEAAAQASWLLARTAQRLGSSGLATPARLWCVTQGVKESGDESVLGHGSLWGLGRIIGGEHPEFWGGIIDIGRSPDDVPGLIDVLRGVRGEDVVVVRDGVASLARLKRVEGDPIQPVLTCQPESTYLVTGGLGALGLHIADWLAHRGARRIVLAGRQAPSRDAFDDLNDARVAAIRSLERLGVTVVPVAVDIADPEAAAKLLSPAALGLPPIRGVVHAAGVLDNRTLRTLDEASLRTVMRPKVNGAMVLHRLFPPGTVDFFALFSSCGQLLGLPGQAAYAAGNAFLDALAAHRRVRGDSAAASLGWTSWRALGMSTSSAVIDVELAARGTGDITAAEAFGAWEVAQRHDLGYAAVLRILASDEPRIPLLSDLSTDTAPVAVKPAASTPWKGLEGVALQEVLVEEVSRQVASETGLAATEVHPRRALAEMGVDSVMTVRIRRGLERRFRLALPATLFWDRPTIDAVATLLAQRLNEE